MADILEASESGLINNFGNGITTSFKPREPVTPIPRKGGEYKIDAK